MPTERNAYLSVIVPTLNEERHIQFLLSSLENQPSVTFETIIVDGGSNDGTSDIARQYNVKVVELPGAGEFVSRNFGAKLAKGTLLLFTCADIIFPEGLFARIVEKFEEEPALVALTGPGHPYDASTLGEIEYGVYNSLRNLITKIPKPLKRFSTSTNFLVVTKAIFSKIGGFNVNDVNADGLMGRKLLDIGKVGFFSDTYVRISARRMSNMGVFGFNAHYLYVFENLFFFLSQTNLLKNLKLRSKMKHRKLHEV